MPGRSTASGSPMSVPMNSRPRSMWARNSSACHGSSGLSSAPLSPNDIANIRSSSVAIRLRYARARGRTVGQPAAPDLRRRPSGGLDADPGAAAGRASGAATSWRRRAGASGRAPAASAARTRRARRLRPAPMPNIGDDPVAAEHEGEEDRNHDDGRGVDHAAGLGEADPDRPPVVAGLQPLLVHPADQEDLVVHRQPEQHGHHDHRQEGSIGPARPRPRARCPSPTGRPRRGRRTRRPTAARFITAALSGTPSERKASSRSRKPRRDDHADEQGEFAEDDAAKSS